MATRKLKTAYVACIWFLVHGAAPVASKFLPMAIKALWGLTAASLPASWWATPLGQRVPGTLALLSLQHASALRCPMELALAVTLPVMFSTESLSCWILPPFTCHPVPMSSSQEDVHCSISFSSEHFISIEITLLVFFCCLMFYCLSLPDYNLSSEKAGALSYSSSCRPCLALCLAHNGYIISDEWMNWEI